MIIPVITLVLGGVGGFAFGRGRGIQREKQLRSDLEESQKRLAQSHQEAAVMALPPASADAPSPLPQDQYREPDPNALVNLPVDREDFVMLRQAICQCLDALGEEKDEGELVTAGELRDCLLEAIYPEFQWPPVPGDPASSQLMWLIADHEARKAIAEEVVCPKLVTLQEAPTNTSEFVPHASGEGG